MEPILTQYMFNIQPINPAYAGMWEKVGFSPGTQTMGRY
jgi:hypothetical protein